jgi:hypothetical protein
MGSDTDDVEPVAAHFRIEEAHSALCIKAHKSLARWERLVFCAGVPALLGYISFTFLGWWSIVLAAAAATLLFAGATGRNAQLYATKLEFVTTGNIGRRGASGRVIVFTADVERLEFRDPTGQRSGLYAVTARKEHCILPFLDYSQTMEVIRAIENKFPGLAERWRGKAASAGTPLSGSLGGLF